MEEEVTFPLLPSDQRFLVREERYKRYVPPSAETRHDPDQFQRSKASVAAGEALQLYFTEHMYEGCEEEFAFDVPVRTKPRRWVASLRRLSCFTLAIALMPVGVVWLLMSQPELRGQALRAKLPRAADWQRLLSNRAT